MDSSTNANAFKICFWLLSYLLYDPDYLQAIRAETQLSISNDKVDIEQLLQCPLLGAAFEETLRLTTAASSARTVLAPTQIGQKTLRPNTKLLMPYRQLHFDETAFGPQIQNFNPQRFIENPGLSRSQNFKPFGGGVTYCSGRFIARREVIAFVALVLHRYHLELKDANQSFPRQDENKPTLGVIGPVKGDDVVLVIKPRRQGH